MSDPEIYRLRDLLDTIPSEWKGMNVVELDGYVAALIVCPHSIPPSEWLPGVWGSHIGFEDAEGTEATIAAVMGHYSRIARELAESPEDYAPVLGVDANSGESLWQPWIDGFERGMRLRRAVWRQIARSDDREAATSLNLIIALSDSCRGRSDLDERGGSGAQGGGAGDDPRVRVQPARVEEVPTRRGRQHGTGCVACGSRWPADRRRRNRRAQVWPGVAVGMHSW